MKKLFLILTGIFAMSLSYSQSNVGNACDYIPPKQANIWYFTQQAGIDFNNSRVVPLTNNDVLQLGKSSSVISDADGNLLLFSDGVHVWNRNFTVLPHGAALYGDFGASQSSIFVKNPKLDYIYYLFTVDKIYPVIGSRGLNYSIIDMNLENGLGDVTYPNNPLLDEAPEKITAVHHKNGKDVWVVAHGWGSNGGGSFYSYLVNDDGVSTSPVVSTIGYIHEGDLDSNNTVGYMKASPDGRYIALAIYGQGVVEVLNFNNETGELSNPKTSQRDFEDAFGLEFSPDASKLYITSSPPISFPAKTSYLYQFDLNENQFFNNPRIIASSTDSIMGDLQLGTDGKIYVSRFVDVQQGKPYLGLIENPNRQGSECNYVEQGFYLGGQEGSAGLPNFMQSYLYIPTFTYLNHCHKDTTQFQITNTSNINSANWDFGDSGNASPGNSLTPTHVFSEPGTYNVTVNEVFNGNSFANTEEVTIYPNPDIDLGPDTIFLYPGASFTLDAGPGYDYYYWNNSTQSTGQYYVAGDTGMYYVTVVDTNCCYNIDSIRILPSKVYLPNAFTPNNDGINDVFKALGPSGGILDFQLFIFNRMGQVVLESDDIEEGWDGTFNGNECPAGVYIFKLSYRVQLDFNVFDDVVLRGHITLLR